jgi:hypothetical protein
MENIYLIGERKIKVKTPGQLEELMRFIRNLANSTRIWIKNGYSPNDDGRVGFSLFMTLQIVPACYN